MFQLMGFIQAIGVSVLITICFSFMVGFLSLASVEWSVLISFLVSYISIGIFAPLWNRKTPYFATFLGSITIVVINFIFSTIILRIPVLVDPLQVNQNLTASVAVSLSTALLVIPILKRNERNSYD
ncbi:hypothetical protein [Salinibacillus xinjiangensis]|uniref:Uncharacterized protein n=1 Tax=Salinibacillus xinjiangensis TaxID=1229268 RepID=A0A6G1X8Q2_9BACI|nr:hypothetical protein [Salinibacillus xinjiangensis]MRG87383.1 hypothetical protein [Salinibacillus xinjiangensis]